MPMQEPDRSFASAPKSLVGCVHLINTGILSAALKTNNGDYCDFQNGFGESGE
jgi:hypothetical protein